MHSPMFSFALQYFEEKNKHKSTTDIRIQGIFLSVLAKTQFVQNGKTQFEKAKTQFENQKSPIHCKFYTMQ